MVGFQDIGGGSPLADEAFVDLTSSSCQAGFESISEAVSQLQVPNPEGRCVTPNLLQELARACLIISSNCPSTINQESSKVPRFKTSDYSYTVKMLVEVYQNDNGNRDVQSYESVTYDGVEYNLHDCIIFYRDGEIETYIGKIIEIIGTAGAGKQVKVVWFFRPSEIRNYLRDYKPRWNEIFLASGDSEGLSNTNFLEAVLGKCTVVCISNDKRNPPPSKDELRSADYIFSCTFDVGKLKISGKFPDQIHGIRVENFFNKRKDEDLRLSPTQKPRLSYPTRNSNLLPKQRLDKVVDVVRNDQRYEKKDSMTKKPQVGLATPTKVRCSANVNLAAKPKTISVDRMQERIPSGLFKRKAKRKFSEIFSPLDSLKPKPVKKKHFSEEVKTAATQQRVEVLQGSPHLNLSKDMGKNSNEASSHVEQDQATKRDNDTPWEERLQKAQEWGTLVLLENLEPTYSSSEVEEIVLSAFNERVHAKMIERTPFSCHPYGKAFVIFQSKDAANTVIDKLNRGCLMLTDKRPVVVSAGIVRKQEESKLFTGHYKIRPKRLTEDMRSAVATAHCSQENTVEHSMAMEWRLLQEKSERWWKQLHEIQGDEMLELKKQLRINI